MEINKKDVRKIRNATKEELGKLQTEYQAATANIRGMSPFGLMLLGVVGVLIILYFSNVFFDIIGLILMIYPLYVFIHRGGHRKGYFEGYYDMMSKLSSRDEKPNSDKADEKSDKAP